MKEWDEKYLRRAIAVAARSRKNGNHPFGATLVDEQGKLLLEAENSVVTQQDCTGHAELNLMRAASQQFEPGFLAGCTLYTSTEPCPMCTAAIFWGNVRRVVYGLSEAGLYDLIGEGSQEVLRLPCRELLKHGRKDLEIIGPLIEDEALSVHIGFWEL